MKSHTWPQVPQNLRTLSTLCTLLAISSLTLAHSAHDFKRHHHNVAMRKARRADPLPDGWTAQGCYSDGPGPRTFTGAAMNSNNMTHALCVNYCQDQGYIYAGMEYSHECYCDNAIRNTGALVTEGCDMPCEGDATQTCGGPYRMTVYKSSAPPPPEPQVVETYGNWTSQGCWTDNGGARTLPVGTGVQGAMTVGKCLDACQAAGYPFAGLEYSAECYCGAQTQGTGAPATSGCTMTCAGNNLQYCGGPDRLNLYAYNGQIPNQQEPPPTGSGGTTDGAPTGWFIKGCYTDAVGTRTLPAATIAAGDMTYAKCANFCAAGNYLYAGLEYGQECFCDNTLHNGGAPAADGCTMPCAGDNTKMCGGPNRLTLLQRGSPNLPTGWSEVGCYTDQPGARTLNQGGYADGAMTHMKCATHCAQLGYKYAGVEYGQECYCDNAFQNGGGPATDGCTTPCAGDAQTTCGGPNRLNVFSSDGTTPPVDPEDPPPAGGTPTEVPSYGNWVSDGCYVDNNGGRSLTVGMPVNGALTIQKCLNACFAAGYGFAGTEYAAECYCGTAYANGAAPATNGCTMACAGNGTQLCGGPDRLNAYHYTGNDLPPITPPGGGGQPGGGGPTLPAVTEGLPAPWHYAGCWVDLQYGRILPYGVIDDPNRTVQQCISQCSALNYTLAGIEYGVQCFCGNEIRYAGSLATNQNDCNMPCGGDAAHACGAGDRISLYSAVDNVPVYPVPGPKTTGLPGKWKYNGCYKEPDYPAPRVFQKQVIMENDMSATKCLNLCAKYGYPASGFEFGNECYCGDPEDIATKSAGVAPEADCTTACKDDPSSICGGPLRLTTYIWDGPELANWQTPENKGRYEFLIGGPIVPLQTSLGINNKVTFLEKLGSGPQNSTHAYELDYTIPEIERAWREMHVKTDIFCAAGVILPDKAGRQLNVGGWSLDSTFGVRLYTPDGTLGVNGTNDWEEDVNVLALQVGRWYPTSMIMSNGSILIVGGQIGANDAPTPTLEVLPRVPGGSTLLYMEWLERTDPLNLYPFMHVLPGGGIYVQYYNEARILDPVSFATVAEMPILPGAVNKAGGRTYPLEGSGVMLPQHYPYTDPVVLMSCGGSDDFYGLDNCVSITPEVAGAEWIIERMPFPRVMPCMAALPDGTFLIVAGARQGQAGFGLAIEPVLTALLYDPSQPVGSRFSILADTILPRMYHSEAILLHDGRVMVSGSDPLDERFGEEYRVEVFIPPYLNLGIPQPTFTIQNTDWAYGGTYPLVITSTTSLNIRASLIGGGVSTHGNSMGQRTMFPKIACAGNVCQVTAPPDDKICPPGWFQLFILDGPVPSYSIWVRIGGDPARLGEWPALPGFTPPGM